MSRETTPEWDAMRELFMSDTELCELYADRTDGWEFEVVTDGSACLGCGVHDRIMAGFAVHEWFCWRCVDDIHKRERRPSVQRYRGEARQ